LTDLISEKKILGIGPRLLNAADRLAPLLGTVNGGLRPFMSKGGGGVGGALNVVKTGISNFSFDSPIDTTMAAINQPAVYPIASGVGSWAGGLIASEIGNELGGDIGGFLKTGGSASMKFGVSSIFMGILSAYFLEQKGGGGILSAPMNAIGGYVGGGGQNSRIKQDNPDMIPVRMQRGIVSGYGRTEN